MLRCLGWDIEIWIGKRDSFLDTKSKGPKFVGTMSLRSCLTGIMRWLLEGFRSDHTHVETKMCIWCPIFKLYWLMERIFLQLSGAGIEIKTSPNGANFIIDGKRTDVSLSCMKKFEFQVSACKATMLRTGNFS